MGTAVQTTATTASVLGDSDLERHSANTQHIQHGLAQRYLVASLCEGVVRPEVLPAHVRPLQLLPSGPGAALPPSLGHRQYRQLDLRIPACNLPGADLGSDR